MIVDAVIYISIHTAKVSIPSLDAQVTITNPDSKVEISNPIVKVLGTPIAVSGAGGTTDHRYLTYRDANDQHPISSITDLQAVVDKVDSIEGTSFVRDDYTYTTDLTITVDDADFVVRDTTDTLTKFIWRDHSAGLLYLGSENAVVTFRSDVDVASKKLAITGALTLTDTLDSAFKVNQTITNNTGIAISAIQAYPTFNGNGQNPIAVDVEPIFSPGITNTSTTAFAIVNTVAPGSGINITGSYAVNVFNKFSDVAGSANISVALQASPPIVAGALKPTDQFGVRISNQGVAGITNAYGLYVASQSGATNNYAAIFAGGNVGIGTTTPDTKLDVNGAITQRELNADPSDPDEGSFVTWMSDGAGSGDDGDIMMKITAGGVTKITTLVDFSTL